MQKQNNGRVNVNTVLTFVKIEEKTEFIFMYGLYIHIPEGGMEVI